MTSDQLMLALLRRLGRLEGSLIVQGAAPSIVDDLRTAADLVEVLINTGPGRIVSFPPDVAERFAAWFREQPQEELDPIVPLD